MCMIIDTYNEIIQWSYSVADHHLYDIPQRHERSLLPSPRNEPQQSNREKNHRWNHWCETQKGSVIFSFFIWKEWTTIIDWFKNSASKKVPVALLTFTKRHWICAATVWPFRTKEKNWVSYGLMQPNHTKIIEDRSGLPEWWPKLWKVAMPYCIFR